MCHIYTDIKASSNPVNARKNFISKHYSEAKTLPSIHSMIQAAKSFNIRQESGKTVFKVSRTCGEAEKRASKKVSHSDSWFRSRKPLKSRKHYHTAPRSLPDKLRWTLTSNIY